MSNGEWLCPRCGTQNQSWRNWCEKCSFAQEQARPSGPPPAPPRPAASVNPRVIGIVVVVLLVAAAAAFALTRGGDGSSTPTAATAGSSASEATTTTVSRRTDEQRAADESAATGVLLQLADVPGGWVVAPAETGGHISASQLAHDPSFRDCVATGADPGVLDVPSEVESDTFTDDAGLAAQSQVTVYANERLARDDIDLLKLRNAPTCVGTILDRDFAEQIAGITLSPDVKYANAVIEGLDVGAVHGEVVAVRASVPIQVGQEARHVLLDLVYVRKGRTIVTMRFIADAVAALPIDAELAITNVVVDRASAS